MKNITLKIKIFDKETKERYTLVTGNNYKEWFYHLQDLINRNCTWEYPNGKPKRVLNIVFEGFEIARYKFVGYGLKWCEITNFQEKLDKENRKIKVDEIPFENFNLLDSKEYIEHLNDWWIPKEYIIQ
ncbi:MAG: hypothetical protein KC550_06270 [Nanoarchaeota archaeon]|nr:hypothetical protein [Nanoarchaeota archaeon]